MDLYIIQYDYTIYNIIIQGVPIKSDDCKKLKNAWNNLKILILMRQI